MSLFNTSLLSLFNTSLSPSLVSRLISHLISLSLQAHYLTTGPEIWAQMGGAVDWFVASGSTGGTMSGIGRYLKERDPRVRTCLPDPKGSIYYEYWHTRQEPKDAQGCTYLVEGIGEDHVCKVPLSILSPSLSLSIVSPLSPILRSSLFFLYSLHCIPFPLLLPLSLFSHPSPLPPGDGL